MSQPPVPELIEETEQVTAAIRDTVAQVLAHYPPH